MFVSGGLGRPVWQNWKQWSIKRWEEELQWGKRVQWLHFTTSSELQSRERASLAKSRLAQGGCESSNTWVGGNGNRWESILIEKYDCTWNMSAWFLPLSAMVDSRIVKVFSKLLHFCGSMKRGAEDLRKKSLVRVLRVMNTSVHQRNPACGNLLPDGQCRKSHIQWTIFILYWAKFW